MAKAVKTWLKEQNKIIKVKTIEELSSTYCFRDPIRPIHNNSELIYSPADGIIIDISSVSSVDDVIYSKYGDISLSQLSYGMIPDMSYKVVTIFLTFYDIHIIRMPVNAIVNKINLPPIYVENRPMLEFENNIFDGKYKDIRIELVNNFAYNQRTIYSLKNPFLKDKMYLLLTADYDIDTILDFSDQTNRSMKQNHRLASIRYGSMVTCIVPDSWNTEVACKINTHVEAGNDYLFYYG